MLRVRRSGSLSVVVVAFLALVVGQADATTSWPTRSRPLSSTLGWFKAINAHDRKRLLYYVAPNARAQMGWAVPSRAWPKFTAVDCRPRHVSARNTDLRCSFHESGSPATAGNPDSFFDVYLHQTHRLWLIESYGQG